MNLDRLNELNKKIATRKATPEEELELVRLLSESGNLDEKYYNEYKAGQYKDDILKAAIMISHMVILGEMLDKL